MILPVELNQKIVVFFTSLPNMQDQNAWKALINSASLDEQLQGHIDFSGSPGSFFQRLVSILINYGTLADDRHALIAVLEAAQKMVGKNRKTECRILIDEVSKLIRKETQIKPIPNVSELKRLRERHKELEFAYQMVSENIRALNEDYHNTLEQSNKIVIKRKLDKQQAEREKIEQGMRAIEAEME